MFEVQVPARICFFGDHQDYLGLPVIAGAINRFMTLQARSVAKKEFQIELKDLDVVRNISLEDELVTVPDNDYFRSAMAILKNEGFEFDQGYRIEISGNIPLNSGLSSSSALVVAWIRFLVSTQENHDPITDEQIAQWAYKAEVLYFEQPGGLMDQYTVAMRGLLYIEPQSHQVKRLAGNLGKLVVAESGIEKQTIDILKNGRIFQEKAVAAVKKEHPDFDLKQTTSADFQRYLELVPKEYHDHWYAAIHNFAITQRAKALLSSEVGNLNKLGELMNQHQLILQERIQNTPLAMTKMMHAAKKAGAIAAKTIGSGGGGSMAALVGANSIEQVIDAFLANGASAAYEVKLVYP